MLYCDLKEIPKRGDVCIHIADLLCCIVEYIADLLRCIVETGEGNGTPLQYSCLENPMDRGAW